MHDRIRDDVVRRYAALLLDSTPEERAVGLQLAFHMAQQQLAVAQETREIVRQRLDVVADAMMRQTGQDAAWLAELGIESDTTQDGPQKDAQGPSEGMQSDPSSE